MPSDSPFLIPSSPEPAVPPTSIRLAGTGDAQNLGAWLQSRHALPVAAARARQALLEGLLARPERGACVVAQASAGPDLLGCLPVTLIPHLELAGLAALATEWWAGDVPAGRSAALLLDCCGLLADWCSAHGVRHLLLAPALLTAAQAAPAGFAPHASGLWHLNLSPAAKILG
ncbi:hypothetical protein [Cupriavidus basilensis]|uniref:hypothetical protein n=1 Tax=Cupriavidus basilensis TaxID=68895 RepID=UPI001F438428|nr:hypothetical protein [Cupriavidus basilensis]